MSIDDFKLTRDTDGRYAVDEQTEKDIYDDIMGSDLSLGALAIKWKVSKTKIWNMRNPDKAKANSEARKKNYKGKYYNTKTANESKAKNRAKKRKLIEDLNKS